MELVSLLIHTFLVGLGCLVAGLIETITNSVQLKLELELSLAKMHSSTLLELCTHKNINVCADSSLRIVQTYCNVCIVTMNTMHSGEEF